MAFSHEFPKNISTINTFPATPHGWRFNDSPHLNSSSLATAISSLKSPGLPTNSTNHIKLYTAVY
jgi:hypothetical protein